MVPEAGRRQAQDWADSHSDGSLQADGHMHSQLAGHKSGPLPALRNLGSIRDP